MENRSHITPRLRGLGQRRRLCHHFDGKRPYLADIGLFHYFKLADQNPFTGGFAIKHQFFTPDLLEKG